MICLLFSGCRVLLRLALGAILLLAIGPVLPPPAAAQDPDEQQQFGLGNVAVNKTRVVFEGRQRSDEVFLFNRGTATATYRIFFKNMRMTEDGSYEDIAQPDPGQLFANKIIRYSPRQVTIPAGSSQTVRLLVRKPRDLAAGEYRSHLVFRALPPPSTGADVEAPEPEEGQILVRMVPQIGVSIPVIVRQGDLPAGLTLSDLALEPPTDSDEPPLLTFRFDRSGERSVYGDVIVTFNPEGGGEVEIGFIRGISVLTPNPTRTVRLRLRPPEGVALRGGRLHVLFREAEEQPGAVVAEAEILVP